MRTDTNRTLTGFILGLLLAMAVTMLVFLCLISGGCTRMVPYPVESVHTEYVHADTAKFLAIINSLKEQISQKESKKESLIHKEKETVTLNEKGDTTKHNHFIYISLESEERSEYERKIENLRDSISDLNERLVSVKADSVPVPYPVERELTRWEKTKMDIGGWAIGAGSVLIVAVIGMLVWLIKIKRRK